MSVDTSRETSVVGIVTKCVDVLRRLGYRSDDAGGYVFRAEEEGQSRIQEE